LDFYDNYDKNYDNQEEIIDQNQVDPPPGAITAITAITM
jgi:hypothetical protein